MLRKILGAITIAMMVSGPAAARDWQLDSGESTVSFVSVKAGEVGEAHRFGALSGRIAADGSFVLELDLASVQTGIDIRDQRMREHFFETGAYPVARLEGSLDSVQALQALSAGERMDRTVEATLSLHGMEQAVSASVAVYRIAGDRVVVTSLQPVLLHVADFGLLDGLNTLRDLAGLPSITPVVPVTFTLQFSEGD